MRNSDFFFADRRGRLTRTSFLLCFCLFAASSLTAQITQDFSTSTTGTNAYVDPLSPLTQHILVNTMPPQTQPNAATVGLVPGYQVTYTPTRDRDVNGGLADGELFGAVDVTVPASSDNNMGSLTIDMALNPPPSGNNNVYLLEDPDGLATLRFNPVVVGANASFSMSYIIANTSYENSDGGDDRIAIYLVNLGDASRIELFSAMNEQIPRNETWATLNRDLTDLQGATLQLVVEFDTNSSAEEMALDNIIFSAGTLQADWPGCANPTVPALTQFPASVCPGIPFRLNIDGNLNNATEWVIYSDEAGTQEVGRTSSNALDVFAGAVDGTAFFVRGEGGCTNNTVFAGLILDIDASDCVPDATPGTSFEEPLGATTEYVDTGNSSERHDLVNNQGQPTVHHAFKAQELGFTMNFAPFRTGTSGTAGLTDGDAVGVSNDSEFAFPDGDQGLVLEDTDGALAVLFTPVDLTGLSNVMISFDYFVNATSYESSETGTDLFGAGLAQGDNTLETIILARGDGSTGLPGLATGVWTTVTYAITGTYTEPVQLFFQVDFDAGTERILIDNVSFSAGTIVCQDTDAPVVTCPDPIMMDGDDNCAATVDFAATATDDCSSNVTFTYSQASGTTFPGGVTPVTVTATDESGKSSMCTFEVTVNDVTPPVLNCPDITVPVNAAGSCSFFFVDGFYDPMASDNCGTVTLSVEGGGASLAGETVTAVDNGRVFNWTATDAAGLTSTCSNTLTVIVSPACFPTSVTGQDATDFSTVRATPNPFTEGTTVSFRLPFNTEVSVDVLDISGRVLQSGQATSTADQEYNWYWDATTEAGGRVPAGMYFVHLRAQGQRYTQRIILIR